MPTTPATDSRPFDTVIAHGRWFDGEGSPSAIRNLGIRDGRVAAISEAPLAATPGGRVIDARGKWVLPGFVDTHTHYDAEVLVSPGLKESVRHGVTTVVLGNCSLSTIHGTPLDCADLFSRVEAVPRQHVLAALLERKTWSTASGYVRFLESLPLGPNVAAFLGHSDLRASVMGLGRSTDPEGRATRAELERMETLLGDALDAGLLGLSSMHTQWDKLDGDRYRSRPLPSTFAPQSELRRLYRVLRRRDRVLQSAPNVASPTNFLTFFLASLGALVRRPLKVSLLTAADAKALPIVKVMTAFTRIWNAVAGTALRWQHLPVPFEVYADGIDLVVFEELGVGRAALHLKEDAERRRLFENDGYRAEFRKEYDKRLSPRVWQRDFHDAPIVSCPDASVVGKTFGQVADERGVHPVDAFLDLVAEHGPRVRWRTVIANHRPEVLDRLAAHPAIHMGFADSGAHLRNMAFYNFPVRLLKRVHEAERAGRPFLSVERAVHRLTGELAGWFGIDAGRLRVGDRADVAIVDPSGLDSSVDGYHEAEMPEFGGIRRMVNRSDRAVVATLVGGAVVYEDTVFAPGFGETLGPGRFLRAGERVAPAATGRPVELVPA
jgi:N-acyl-D-aspartate/D-glutamate deacylase